MYKITQTPPLTPRQNLQHLAINPQKNIQGYMIDYGKLIGKGNFSNVFACIHKNKPSQRLAAKVININILRAQNIQHLLQSEIDILLSLHHQNIISCKDVFIDENWCYIITEFCQGGNLEMKLANNGILTEQQALKIIKDVLQGLSYLEKNHIIHRDIKVANIFLKANGTAIIADFGFACTINQPFHDLNIGSLPYMAPQSIINSYYTPKNDVWSFGVFMYHLFHGESPYARCHTIQQLQKKVVLPLNIEWLRPQLSIAMKQMILNCLQVNWKNRPSLIEIKQAWHCKHLFFQQVTVSSKKLDENKKNFSVQKQTPKGLKKKKAQFRAVLQKIHYCRTLFKLISRLDTDEDKRKYIFANHAYSQIQKVLQMIENDDVNYGLGNSQSRKKKLKTVAEDYAYEFRKQMRRKEIQAYSGEIKSEQIRQQLQKALYDCNVKCRNVELKERAQLMKSLIRELLSARKVSSKDKREI